MKYNRYFSIEAEDANELQALLRPAIEQKNTAAYRPKHPQAGGRSLEIFFRCDLEGLITTILLL